MSNRRTSLALSATAALSLLFVLDSSSAQAQRVAKPNNYENLVQRGQNLRDDVRAIKCFKDKDEEKFYYDLLNAFRDAITNLENSTYPRRKHAPLDWHIDRLDTIATQIANNLFDVPMCPPPAEPQNVMPSPPPEPPKSGGDTVAPGHSSAATPDTGSMLAASDLAHNDWTLLGNYANFDPSSGSSADQWGGSVRGQTMIGQNLAIDFGGAYNNVSGGGSNLDNWTADASLVWYLTNMRVGPTIGYQNNSESGFHSDTWNYGGFAEYFWPHVTLGGKGGGFSTNTSFTDSDGYYLGGSVTGYVCPNFSIVGAVDYTHFSPAGGSDETDWTMRGTWRLWTATPLAFWAGYTYSDFSPGSFHVSTISVGVQFDLGNSQTLIESDRGGAIVNQAAFYPLALKF